jgi:prepilin-type N-terminal cleavage/methylation domain-containing protein
MQPNHRYRTGFTLIELLTVIAIIAILAALLFPVFGRVREQTHQAQCFTNMHDIYRALKLYKEDNNRYPASLLGYAEVSGAPQFYTGSGTPATLASLFYRPLFNGQKYLKDTSLFNCPDAKVKDPTVVTTAVYPATAGPALAGQTVTFTPLIQHYISDSSITWPGNGQSIYFYAYDSYDLGPQIDSTGKPVMSNGQSVLELHYSLDWTGGSGSGDAKNQLKYAGSAPEDQTVAYWCSNHVAYAGSNNTLVLLLSGTTKTVDAKKFAQQGPLNFTP